MIIPTWNEAKERVASGRASPLDYFVSEHEPLIQIEANAWRADLAKLLSFTMSYANPRDEFTVKYDDAEQQTIHFTD